MEPRYWIGWTTDGWATLIRQLPDRPREVWVTDGPVPGDEPEVRIARRPRPIEVGRLDAERFVLQRLPDVGFLDDGDPEPPTPLLDPTFRPGWGGGRFARLFVMDHWVPATEVGMRTTRIPLLGEVVRALRIG